MDELKENIQTALIKLHSGAGKERAPVCLLTDAVHNVVSLGGLGGVLVKCGGKSAICILDGKTLSEVYADGFAVFGEDLGLTPAGTDDYAVMFALGAVFFAAGHFLIGFKAVHSDGICAAAYGSAGYVAGDVAAADDDYVPLKL